MTLLDDLCAEARAAGIQEAVDRRDTPTIFNWLVAAFSYQGISDAVARSYSRQHGIATWEQITHNLERQPPCPRLRGYRHYHRCRYDKTSSTCSEPEHIDVCPVPTHRLRNGRLNQTAYSFYLFVRDIAGSDLVGWIDGQLSTSEQVSNKGQAPRSGDQLICALRNVYGVSDKVLTMTLAGLLLGASAGRPNWFKAGVTMMAIDTLVHNWLHRTGILADCGTPHSYGPACYQPGACADIIGRVAALIDARAYNSCFPPNFPRFVQHSIWRFCAADGLNMCNGNRLDDRQPCNLSYCNLFLFCSKMSLKPS